MYLYCFEGCYPVQCPSVSEVNQTRFDSSMKKRKCAYLFYGGVVTRKSRFTGIQDDCTHDLLIRMAYREFNGGPDRVFEARLEEESIHLLNCQEPKILKQYLRDRAVHKHIKVCSLIVIICLGNLHLVLEERVGFRNTEREGVGIPGRVWLHKSIVES